MHRYIPKVACFDRLPKDYFSLLGEPLLEATPSVLMPFAWVHIVTASRLLLHRAETRADRASAAERDDERHLKSPTATASDLLRIFTATMVPYHFALCTVPNSPSPTCSQDTESRIVLRR